MLRGPYYADQRPLPVSVCCQTCTPACSKFSFEHATDTGKHSAATPIIDAIDAIWLLHKIVLRSAVDCTVQDDESMLMQHFSLILQERQ